MFNIAFRNVQPAPSAPLITTQPESQSVNDGSPVTFTVAASGYPAPTYQWQVNESGSWVNIGGATSSSYLIEEAVSAQDGNQYRCVATNASGSATSNAATLTVLAALPCDCMGEYYPSLTIMTPDPLGEGPPTVEPYDANVVGISSSPEIGKQVFSNGTTTVTLTKIGEDTYRVDYYTEGVTPALSLSGTTSDLVCAEPVPGVVFWLYGASLLLPEGVHPGQKSITIS